MDDFNGNSTTVMFERIDVRYGYYTICGSMIFFQILNKIFAFFGKPEKIHEDDFWRWRNLLCSWSHAFVTGSLTIYCLIAYSDVMYTDLLDFVAPVPYLLIAFSTGYFLYDTGDMIMAKELLPNWEVVLHHIADSMKEYFALNPAQMLTLGNFIVISSSIAVIATFYYDVIYCTCIGYNVVILLAEVNSFFLHTRKLMQMLGTSFSNRFYRFNNVVNLLTFAFCRTVSLGMIMYGLAQPSERARVPLTYVLTLAAAEGVMCMINPILFVRLIKNDILRPLKSDEFSNNNVQNGKPKKFNLREVDE